MSAPKLADALATARVVHDRARLHPTTVTLPAAIPWGSTSSAPSCSRPLVTVVGP